MKAGARRDPYGGAPRVDSREGDRQLRRGWLSHPWHRTRAAPAIGVIENVAISIARWMTPGGGSSCVRRRRLMAAVRREQRRLLHCYVGDGAEAVRRCAWCSISAGGRSELRFARSVRPRFDLGSRDSGGPGRPAWDSTCSRRAPLVILERSGRLAAERTLSRGSTWSVLHVGIRIERELASAVVAARH